MNIVRILIVATALVLVGCSPQPVAAPGLWQLDGSRSGLAFVSIKAGDLPEAHRFGQLSGSVDASGAARIDVALASVDTGIEIRDERMREHVFQLDSFPTASITATLDTAEVTALPVGAQLDRILPVELGFSGVSVALQAKVTVLRAAVDEVVVSAREPVLLNASSLGIADGLEVLRGLAGLPSISTAVPVDFQLTFVGADSG